MTSDTFASKNYGAVYCGPAGLSQRNRLKKIAEAGIYPGYLMRVHTDKFLYLTKSSDKAFAGVACDMEGYDIDTVYAINTPIEYYGKGSKNRVYIFLVAASPAPAIEDGEEIVVSATDGMGMSFAYTDGTDITDTTAFTHVGYADELVTGSTSDNKLLAVILS